jgi:hypothetical protein
VVGKRSKDDLKVVCFVVNIEVGGGDFDGLE